MITKRTIKMKKVLRYICFPFIFIWVSLGVGIMYLGDGIHWLGNAMTGFRADTSFGKIYME